ncbi:hypothetical protein AB0O68_15550 [Streptomyces sp. NPDC087512]|uniref:hypothetical protein n=1 Tax=Streptomyces sp. NPDC087512 TaxID=3155059 RepID=UPI0034352C66
MPLFKRKQRKQLSDERHTERDWRVLLDIENQSRERKSIDLELDLQAAMKIHRLLTHRPSGETLTARKLSSILRRGRLRAFIGDPVLAVAALYASLPSRVTDPDVAETLKRQGDEVMRIITEAGLVDASSAGLLVEEHQSEAWQLQPEVWSSTMSVPVRLSGLPQRPLEPEDAAAAAPAAEETLESALARLFLRLGPPPEPTELDYTPVGRGGGGAQQ